MSSPNFYINSYISATVHHANPYITLGLPVVTLACLAAISSHLN